MRFPPVRALSLLVPGVLIVLAVRWGAALSPALLGPRLLIPWGLALAVFSRGGRGFGLATLFRPTHALPALVQSLIFAYWSVYWRPVREHVPALVLQLVFAYAFDGLLALSARRRWEVSLGPVPIVLSTNLFAQFAAFELDVSLAMISLALLSKALIRRADGTHFFNPSAFGISVVGLFWLTAGLPWQGDVSSQLNLAPNMAELILLLGLVVQLRVRTALLTAFTALGLLITHSLTGLNHFGPLWPAVLVIITLLATDPATIPRTAAGRALSGLALGLCMPLAGAAVAAWTGGWDFYGKVLLVPLANLLAPAFDALGRRFPAGLQRPLDFRFTPAHAAAWFVLAAWLLQGSPKMHEREQELHRQFATPLVRPNPDGAVTCEQNALFCRPFTFLEEGKRWWAAQG